MKGKATRKADKKRRAQEAREQRNKVARSDHQGRNHSTPNISTPPPQQMAPQKISEKSGFLRRFLGRLFWRADKPWKIVVEAAVILILFFDLWAVFSVVPVVSAPASVDPGDLFRTPFSVSNPHYFFTLYNVHPVCGFDESLGFLRQEFALEAEMDVGDLPPQGNPATFVCHVGDRPATPGVRLFLTMHYDVKLLPGLYWPRTREFSYRVALDGEGKAYWQEGEWLYRPPVVCRVSSRHEIITHPMARTKKPIPKERPPLSIHSVTFSAEESAILNRLSQDATDFLGRSISGSAILRALLRQIDKQGPAEADALFIEVEKELKAGVLWGKQK